MQIESAEVLMLNQPERTGNNQHTAQCFQEPAELLGQLRSLACAGLAALLIGCGPGTVDENSGVPSATDLPKSDTVQKVPSESKPSAENTPNESASLAPVQYVAPALTEQELRDGWISLFDGTTLFGWNVPSQSNWSVQDGCITADSGERSLLLTPFEFDDFEFRCEFQLAAGGNSGVFLRTADNAKDPARDTYELNICDSHPTHQSGSLVARSASMVPTKVEGSWHRFHVRCEGPHIKVHLDDTLTQDFTDTSDGLRLSGKIGLQMNGGRIAFRNVFLKPLGTSELLNGKDTQGWRPVPGSKADFTVTDGVLSVSGGQGFLETEETFGDLMLHVEARTGAEQVNSGIFFRAMEGTEKSPSNGYEFQINHGTQNGDRNRPSDSGTGAIFRRIPARYVVGQDLEWFTATLIAQGDQFASWVNGFQVVNWKDTRAPDENPRKGLRLEAGHLSLQGHDPGTKADFRSIRVHRFPTAPTSNK